MPADGQLSAADATGMLGLFDSADVPLLVKAGVLPYRDGRRLRVDYEEVLQQ